jgi:hypothetical protein
MNAQTILLAVLLVSVIVFAAWYIRRATTEDHTEAVEYVNDSDNSHTKGGARIPITARAKGLSSSAKIMFGSMALLFVVLGIFIYQTLSTGSPAEILFADQLRTGAIALVGVVGGIIATNMAQKNEGYLYNIYETDSGDTRTEIIPVDTSGIDNDSDGRPVVTEYKSRRLLGLFRRYKHVGEDAQLDGTHRAPGKPVKHQIADHAVEVKDGEWFQRTSGRNDTNNPHMEHDYTYSSPVELSYDAYLNMGESVRRMRERLHGAEATISVLEKELGKLRDMLETGEYNAEDKILDKFERMSHIMSTGQQTQQGDQTPRQTHVNVGDSDGRQQPSKQAMKNGGGQ